MQGLTDSALYRNVMKTLNTSSEVVGLNKASLEILAHPKRAIAVSVPVRMDNDEIQIFHGYRVQHNQVLGPFKGGLRYHPSVSMSEVAGLAALMTFKNSLLELPLGGAKGGVTVDPSQLSKKELEQMTRRFTSELSPFIGPDKDIPAPDVGTNSQTMAWMLDSFSAHTGFCQTGVVTGKPIEVGGSLGRDVATGLGVVYTIEKALGTQSRTMEGITIAIQGFGKVGLHAANEADALGAKIVAVSDISGGIYNEQGLNISELIIYVMQNKVVTGFPGSTEITNDELLMLNVTVLAPCALDGVITSKNYEDVKARIIVEGANGPVTQDAGIELYKKGIMVVPDILANGGGVAVSYFEWIQDLGWFFWEEEQVRKKLKKIMYNVFDNVWKFSQEYNVDLRTSAMAVSIKRLEKALLLRGQAW